MCCKLSRINDRVQTPDKLLVSAAEMYPEFQVGNQWPGNWRTENKVVSPWQHPSIPWRQGCRHYRRRRRYHHPRTQGNVPSSLQPLFHLCTFLPVTCTCMSLRIGIPCVRKPRAQVFIIPLAMIYGAEGCRSGYITP